MIESANNKYGLILSRSIKVYMIKGTLEEQQQAKATTTQSTSTPTTPTSTLSIIPQLTTTSTFIPSATP